MKGDHGEPHVPRLGLSVAGAGNGYYQRHYLTRLSWRILNPLLPDRGERCLASRPHKRGRVLQASSQAPKSAVDFTDFDESDTGPEGNIARFEEAA